LKNKNILLIFTDQQRFDTIEALGNPIIKTPALNTLVEKGIAFTRAYTPCPVCVPARYSMKTGQMPHRTGCLDNGQMPSGRKSVMEILSENGYQTHGVGKMHFTFKEEGTLAKWGFNTRDISEECGSNDDFKHFLEKEGFGHVHDPQGVRSEMYYIPQPSQLPERLHNTTWVVDKSIDFLEKRDKNKPFFLMTSFIKPHPPFETPTPWNKLYRSPQMPLPKRPQGMENLITYWNRFQNRYKYRDQGIDDNLIRTMKAAYYNCISFMDYNIKRLLEYLNKNDMMKDTLIIYTSDHGEMLGDYNCFGKRCFLDSAARIPMIMVHPEMQNEVKCSKPVSLVDIMPTLLEYAGIIPAEDYSGGSLTSIADGSVKRDTVFGQFNSGENGNYMAVTEQFKYIYSAPDNKEWLYDLRSDPDETRNVMNNLMYRNESKNMKMSIIEYFSNDGYDLPLEQDDWKRYPEKSISDDPDEGLLFQDPDSSIPDIPGYST
jgi:arylsulfatase